MKKNATLVYVSNLLALLFFSLNGPVFASVSKNAGKLFPSKTAYLGINLGGGSTEWKYLVDKTDPPDTPVTASTPKSVKEGGPSWGVVLGYDLDSNFAIELQYMQFADADITFHASSIYTIVDGISSMVSKTHAYSLSGKFFARVAHTRMRAFAAVGGGLVERRDALAKKKSCITPYMSAGVNYSINRHYMIETGFQYYTGFGRSELDPVRHFIPFAWDAYGRLAYQF